MSANGRHRRPRQAPAIVVAAGVTGTALALPLLASASASAADASTWDHVAACESGGLWNANFQNGYYGGLQISQDDWKAYGGAQYAARADLASKSQQIAVAEKILDLQGIAEWASCAPVSGLTAALGQGGSSAGGTGEQGPPDSSTVSGSADSAGSSRSAGSSGSTLSGTSSTASGASGASNVSQTPDPSASGAGTGDSAGTPDPSGRGPLSGLLGSLGSSATPDAPGGSGSPAPGASQSPGASAVSGTPQGAPGASQGRGGAPGSPATQAPAGSPDGVPAPAFGGQTGHLLGGVGDSAGPSAVRKAHGGARHAAPSGTSAAAGPGAEWRFPSESAWANPLTVPRAPAPVRGVTPPPVPAPAPLVPSAGIPGLPGASDGSAGDPGAVRVLAPGGGKHRAPESRGDDTAGENGSTGGSGTSGQPGSTDQSGTADQSDLGNQGDQAGQSGRTSRSGATVADGPSGRRAASADPASQHTGASDVSSSGTGTEYTVHEGDSLSGIAAAQGLDGGWQVLYDANKALLGGDPNHIVPGQSLDLGVG
jgi:resuscitation-promoting factor RpfA